MSSCIACRADAVQTLADFGPQAVCHHFYDGGKEEGMHPMRFGVCSTCGVAQLAGPISPEQLIPRVDWISYNEPELHLDRMVEMLRELPGVSAASSVAGVTYKEDTTLRRFHEHGHGQVWRCDPKADLDVGDPRAGVETILTRIRPELAPKLRAKYGAPNIVIVRHILEHTLDTPAFLDTFRRLVAPGGYVVFEVPECVRGFDLLDYTTLWEDHTLYFVEPTFIETLERHGFRVVRFERYRAAYENCLVAVTQPAEAAGAPTMAPEVRDGEIGRARAFAQGFYSYRRALRGQLEQWRQRGRIVMFGAGHQSATFLNLTGAADLVDAVVDDSPRKCGLRMPGSRVPIVSSKILAEPDVKLCLLSLSAESEKKVIQKQGGFMQRGGAFASIYPVAPGAVLNFAAGATAASSQSL